MVHKRSSLNWLFILIALIPFASSVEAQQSTNYVTIVGTAPSSLVQPLIDRVNEAADSFGVTYTQWNESAILTALETSLPEPHTIDMALLPTPDQGVWLANEGRLDQLTVSTEQPDRRHWRQEVFSVLYDPAVLVVRTDAVNVTKLPFNRRDLVTFLNENAEEMTRRVGLVNIGIDSQSYGYAAQDQLRSLLFWQVMQVFGELDARIFETAGELVQALQSSKIDLAYNVPLSQLANKDLDGLQVIALEDYTIALPWVAVSPSGSEKPYVANAVRLLRENGSQFFSSTKPIKETQSDSSELSFQQVKLGPELLVFLDPIKKTEILENWFQAVIGQ